jgi:hypothetical protein
MQRMLGDMLEQMQKHSSFLAVAGSRFALFEDNRRQCLALVEQVATLQQQLAERDQTLADTQALLREAQNTAGSTAALLEQALGREVVARAERDSAVQETARLSSVVADLKQQLAAARAVATAPAPMPVAVLSPAPEPTCSAADPQLRAALLGECDTIVAQFAQSPALRDAVQRRECIALDGSTTTDSKEGVRAGNVHQAAKQVLPQQALSEVDYQSLADRRVALIQKLTAVCERLFEGDDFDALDTLLASKLQELKVLDVSRLPQSWTKDPVQPPAPPPAGAAEGEDNGVNATVHVPSDAVENPLA